MAIPIKTDSICAYNEWIGVKTQHPLVAFIDFSGVAPIRHSRRLYGFYAVFLKDLKCGDLRYGRRYYDYQEGTLVFVAPGQVFGVEDDGIAFQPHGFALLFHPDLLRGTALASAMKGYSFFDYDSDEALHLSKEERQTIMDCFRKIRFELSHPVDKHSKELLVDNIKTFLDYCARFYDRQFFTRDMVNKDLLSRFNRELDSWFEDNRHTQNGLPNVQWIAQHLSLSPNYLSDMLKKETGTTALGHIHAKIIELAKNELADTSKTVSEIAYGLGFQYPQHFSRLFKNTEGCTPNQYRASLLQ